MGEISDKRIGQWNVSRPRYIKTIVVIFMRTKNVFPVSLAAAVFVAFLIYKHLVNTVISLYELPL